MRELVLLKVDKAKRILYTNLKKISIIFCQLLSSIQSIEPHTSPYEYKKNYIIHKKKYFKTQHFRVPPISCAIVLPSAASQLNHFVLLFAPETHNVLFRVVHRGEMTDDVVFGQKSHTAEHARVLDSD